MMRLCRNGWLVGMLLLLWTACGVDGANPYALWQSYSHPEDQFNFSYLAPPWFISDETIDGHPVLYVEKYAEPLENGLPARMRLEAWEASDQQGNGLISTRRAYWEGLGYSLGETFEHTNAFNDLGWGFEGHQDSFWCREVVFDGDSGTVIMSIWVNGTSGREDVLLLIDSFRPGGVDGK